MNRSYDPSRRELLQIGGTLILAGLSAGAADAQQPVDLSAIDVSIREQAEAAPLANQFRGSTAKECRQWQADFAAKLRGLLGPFSPPDKWKTITERRTELNDHSRLELVLTAEGHPPLPLYLLAPTRKAERPRAGILALHGHGPYGHHPVAGRDDLPGVARNIKNAHYDYGRQLVQRGYVVAVPCLTPFGRRLGIREGTKAQDRCADTFLRLQLLGKLLIAENLRDCLWALELLARDKQVDPKRLGCVGLSYGGRMTMLTAALESRIRVAVVSGALNLMQERISRPYSCGAQIIPGLLKIGDTPEIGSLIAPRPCVWEVGTHDGLIAAKQADDALRRMRRAYRSLGAEAQLIVDRFEGGHVWNGRVAYPLLEKALG
jgi:dienelactone hydrolase